MISDTIQKYSSHEGAPEYVFPPGAAALFGALPMRADQANSPARRIFFALQSAYLTEADQRQKHLAAAQAFMADFTQATTSPTARMLLEVAGDSAEKVDFPYALALIVRIIQHENAVLSHRNGPCV